MKSKTAGRMRSKEISNGLIRHGKRRNSLYGEKLQGNNVKRLNLCIGSECWFSKRVIRILEHVIKKLYT